LKKGGYTVIEARDGLQAIEAAGKHSGKIDLMVTDVVVPGMSGGRVAELLADSRRELKSYWYLICGASRAESSDPGRAHEFPAETLHARFSCPKDT